ncbi:hypothetical protein P3S67_004694 [Capsicum chacoense]
MIVLFDVYDETFREMMVPGTLAEMFLYNSDWFNLFVLEESLCLADHLFDKDKTIDFWRMKGYGDPKSWVKQFSISNRITFNVGLHQVAHFLVKPIASRKNGEILWRAKNGFLVSYDFETEKIENLDICNANFLPYDNALYVDTYKVSLVLLDKRTNYFSGDIRSCEESSHSCKREPKHGRKVLKRQQ